MERRSRSSAILHRTPEPIPQLSISEKIEQVLIGGDLAPLTPAERVDYYNKVSLSIGVNRLTRPFEYILFREPGGGAPRLQLYANKSCTEQLRKIHGVSVTDHQQTIEGDYCHVQVKVQDRTGRTDFSIGSVPLFKYKDGNRFDLSGAERCNAIMKASTKAKRRATLSICGLAFLDESELDTMKIVGGVTPEGRIYHLPDDEPQEMPQLTEDAAHGHEAGSEKAKKAEATLAAVEAEDARLAAERAAKAAPQPQEAAKKYSIEIDLTNPEDPIVRGDVDHVLPVLEKHIVATWKEDWWHIRPVDVQTLHAASKQMNFAVTEFPSQGKGAAVKGEANAETKAQTNAAAPKNQRKESNTLATSGAVRREASSAAPTLVEGTITHSVAGMAGKTPVRDVTVFITESKKKPSFRCFDKVLFPILDKAIGKLSVVLVKQNGNYWNLIGLRRVGSQEFEEDGKTLAAIQLDREPGTPGLFK